MSASLSICIPSFNRIEALEDLLDSLLETCETIDEVHEIILVDDGYDAISVSLIKNKYRNFEKFKYFQNENRGGFGAVYARCLSVANSEFVIITNDDDILFPEGIVNCLNQMRSLSGIGMAVPVWLSGKGKILRGSLKAIQKISASEILKYTAHAPGIIYYKKNMAQHISVLSARISQKCKFSEMYPQVLLAGLIFDSDFAIRPLNEPIGRDGKGLPTEIMSNNNEPYYSLYSRVIQYKALLEIEKSNTLSKIVVTALQQNFLARILVLQERRILLVSLVFTFKRQTAESFWKIKATIFKLFRRGK